MRRRRLLRRAGLALVVIALLLGLYTLVAFLGLRSGQTLRQERVQQTRTAELANQMALAREDVAGGNYRLALQRLEWVLQRAPDYPGARALAAEVEATLQQAPAPTATQGEDATATPTAEPTASPAADGTREGEPAAALQRLEVLVEDEQWQRAITAIVDFQSTYPSYARRESDALLHQAYVGQGVELLYGDQVELGLYYLSQAESLGDLPQEVEDQRQWAELYLGGMAYYGVNWDVSLFYFRDLCRAAPFYQDACDRLYEALLALGEQHVARQDWCPAESLFAEAYQLQASDRLGERLAQAREGCSAATPTPPLPEEEPEEQG